MVPKRELNLFFIVGHGRSGTMFLSRLLNSAERVVVKHEDYDDDIVYFHLGMTNNYQNIIAHQLAGRFKKIFDGLPDDIVVYGEVNSLLRYNIEWIKQNLNPILLHLIRDGRDVVRSMYSRGVYLYQTRYIPAYPDDSDPYSHKWHKMDRFEKLCWYWNQSNVYLKKRIDGFIRFEDILTDYDLLDKKILTPVNIQLTEERWKTMIEQPVNYTHISRTKNFLKKILPNYRTVEVETIPHWKEWDSEMTHKFWEICGDTMREFGYR